MSAIDHSTTLLTHEWLEPRGGAENVFEQLSVLFAGAAKQCLWNDAPERFGWDVRETWLARTPLRRRKALALPLMPSAWDRVPLEGVERVIVSSHAFAHHLAGRASRRGIDSYVYVHTPARYLWATELDGRGRGRLAGMAAVPLKIMDRRRVSESVHYACNSEFVCERIRRAWGVEAVVIYPPVDVERIQSAARWEDRVTGDERRVLEDLPDEFVLGASRLVEYKRLDETIRKGAEMGLPVVIVGSGPHEGALRTLGEEVSVPVCFLGRVSDELLYALYQRATLFVFMAIEDFGIMPVEAIAAGGRVVVNEVGGAAESVRLLGGAEVAEPDLIRNTFGAGAFRSAIAEWIA